MKRAPGAASAARPWWRCWSTNRWSVVTSRCKRLHRSDALLREALGYSRPAHVPIARSAREVPALRFSNPDLRRPSVEILQGGAGVIVPAGQALAGICPRGGGAPMFVRLRHAAAKVPMSVVVSPLPAACPSATTTVSYGLRLKGSAGIPDGWG